MIESALYFALGFLVAGLVALMVLPAIWRRAVRLTQRRIEASTPLSLAEIKAHRDQMRADFARETRRLEMAVGELRRRAAEHQIEARRSSDRARTLTGERDELTSRIAILEQTVADRIAEADRALRARDDGLSTIESQTAELTDLKVKLADLLAEIDTRKVEGAALKTNLEAAETRSDALAEERRQAVLRADMAEIELAKRERMIADDQDRIRRLDTALSERSRDFAQKVEQLRETSEKLAAAQSLAATLEAELEGTRGLLAATEKRAEAPRLGDNLTATVEALERTNAELQERVDRLAAERDRLVAEAETLRRAVGAAADDAEAGAASPAPALSGAGGDAALADRIAGLTAERDRLAAEAAALRKTAADAEAALARALDAAAAAGPASAPVASGREGAGTVSNAILRDKLADLAAQVVAMTARVEGEASPVSRLVGDGPAPGPGPAAPALDDDDDRTRLLLPARPAKPVSLAERIRALQDKTRGDAAPPTG